MAQTSGVNRSKEAQAELARQRIAQEDAAREQRVNQFYDQRRFENLFEARGPKDPLVQAILLGRAYDDTRRKKRKRNQA